MKTIILAGGSGTRLWPLSRDRYPKQFIKLRGMKTSLFQETFLRSLMLSSIDDIYVVTNARYKFLVMGEVKELGYNYREENILVEPDAKSTLPAIYAGVYEIMKKGHDSIVVFPSDHMILNDKEFTSIIKQSEDLATDYIITFGIKPYEPNTGYGYISSGEANKIGYFVNSFKEKPSLEKAIEYIQNGYFWNAGIFMFNSEIFSNEVQRYSPEIFTAFHASKTLNEAFSKIHTGTSIDYGILEKSDIVTVVPIEIGWNDLGSFDSFYDVFEEDDCGNITNESSIVIDSTNNLIQSCEGKVVATVGIDNLIIIDNRDALLVCRKDQSQKVKEVVEELKKRNDPRTEYHVEDYRPWGHYKVLEEEMGLFKIKRITVYQGKRLSYQLHHHRSEHWIVVRGIATVTIEDEIKYVGAGESIYMKAGQKHRLENSGETNLEIIEVQMGEYLDEDDIVRFDESLEGDTTSNNTIGLYVERV